MVAPPRRDAIASLSDDQLGTISVSLVVSELRWTPDVAPLVLDRISRDAVAYPEQFDRRPRPDGQPVATRGSGSTMTRTMTRVVVIVVIIMFVAALVVVAATSNASIQSVTAATAVSSLLEAS
jgi:hypothetical protein